MNTNTNTANETFLMNPHTGSVQTAADWADDGCTTANAELIEVVADENGDWVEAK